VIYEEDRCHAHPPEFVADHIMMRPVDRHTEVHYQKQGYLVCAEYHCGVPKGPKRYPKVSL
jgi:hypothetical protein